jgi:hypothetical protein
VECPQSGGKNAVWLLTFEPEGFRIQSLSERVHWTLSRFQTGNFAVTATEIIAGAAKTQIFRMTEAANGQAHQIQRPALGKQIR